MKIKAAILKEVKRLQKRRDRHKNMKSKERVWLDTEILRLLSALSMLRHKFPSEDHPKKKKKVRLARKR